MKVRRRATSKFARLVQILIVTILVRILQTNPIHCPLGDNPQILNIQRKMFLCTLFPRTLQILESRKPRLSVCTACALCGHCVRTACMLRTQRLGYSPKNTCHLFTRGKTERCQYHRVGQVSIDTSGCSYNQQHRRRRTVRSWCRLATIEYRRSRAFERR